jgi:hypothetical protein
MNIKNLVEVSDKEATEIGFVTIPGMVAFLTLLAMLGPRKEMVDPNGLFVICVGIKSEDETTPDFLRGKTVCMVLHPDVDLVRLYIPKTKEEHDAMLAFAKRISVKAVSCEEAQQPAPRFNTTFQNN